jgi:hypothetical protein
MRQEDPRSVVKDLARGSLDESKFSNWLWLSLLFVSLSLLIPSVEDHTAAALIQLPFGLDQTEPRVF